MAGTKVAKKFWETAKASKMVKGYLKGSTISDLAELYDVTTTTVSKTLKLLGVEMRPRGRRATK